jgi:hypothetical protein
MTALLAHKVVAALPTTLEANSLYFVRVGAGFNVYVTNDAGTVVAYPLNGASGGSGVSGGVVLTIPGKGAYEHRQTFALAGVTPASRIFVGLGTHTDADENDPELLDLVLLAAVPRTDAFDVIATFSMPTQGDIKLNYQVT